jgi:hypothetical protein
MRLEKADEQFAPRRFGSEKPVDGAITPARSSPPLIASIAWSITASWRRKVWVVRVSKQAKTDKMSIEMNRGI